MSIKMKDIPVKERPRERLIKEGVEKLSNEELLSILIGNGTKGVSAKDLSLKVLDKIKSIGNANLLNYRSLLEIKGLGVAKACSLLAAFELGKRVNIENNSLNSEVINNSGAVFIK